VILFDDVGGLEIGDKISYRGMEVGRVKSVQLSPDGILCTIRISTEISLATGSTFYVTDSSLMGGKQLVIEPGSGDKLLAPDQIHKGISGPGMMSAIAKGIAAIDEFRVILSSIEEENGLLDKSSLMIDTATKTIHSVDNSVLQLEQRMQKTLHLVDSTIREINEITSENKDNLGSALAKAPPLMDNISTTIDSLRYLSRDLNSAIAGVGRGEGTAGKLFQDQELYDKLLGSVENLETLISDIRENPRKYFNFSVF
jgi:phospholipid/cholesterol/gamma-HCH transport system substrate-binding protein